MAVAFVDRVPRNKLIATGFCFCGIAVAIEAALTATYLGTDHRAGLQAAVFAFFMYVISFELCLDGPEFFYRKCTLPSRALPDEANLDSFRCRDLANAHASKGIHGRHSLLQRHKHRVATISTNRLRQHRLEILPLFHLLLLLRLHFRMVRFSRHLAQAARRSSGHVRRPRSRHGLPARTRQRQHCSGEH